MPIAKYDRIEKVTLVNRYNLAVSENEYILTGDDIINDNEIFIDAWTFNNNYFIVKREYVKGIEDLGDVLEFIHYRRINAPLRIDREHELFWVSADGWTDYAVAFNLELLGEYNEMKELGWI